MNKQTRKDQLSQISGDSEESMRPDNSEESLDEQDLLQIQIKMRRTHKNLREKASKLSKMRGRDQLQKL